MGSGGDWEPGIVTGHTGHLCPGTGRLALYLSVSILPLLELHPELSDGNRMRLFVLFVFVRVLSVLVCADLCGQLCIYVHTCYICVLYVHCAFWAHAQPHCLAGPGLGTVAVLPLSHCQIHPVALQEPHLE